MNVSNFVISFVATSLNGYRLQPCCPDASAGTVSRGFPSVAQTAGLGETGEDAGMGAEVLPRASDYPIREWPQPCRCGKFSSSFPRQIICTLTSPRKQMQASALTGMDSTGVNDGSKSTTLVTYLSDAWNWGAEMYVLSQAVFSTTNIHQLL